MSVAHLYRLVRERALGHCEYCQLPESASAIPFEIDHIIARKHGGRTEESNLALSCWYCNSAKGPCVGGLTTPDGRFVRLFHPRRDDWSAHFRWNGPVLEGLDDVGQVTVNVLSMNEPLMLALRESLIEEGVFPPLEPTKH